MTLVLRYPCLLVRSNSRFFCDNTKNSISFKLVSNDSDLRDYYFDYYNFIPYRFGVVIEFYKNPKLNNDDSALLLEIKNKIQSEYQNGLDIYVKNLNFENYYSLINLKYSPDDEKKTDNKNPFAFLYSCYTTVSFCQCDTVYCSTEYDKNELKTNPMLQLSLIKKARYYVECIRKLDWAASQFPNYYNRCFDKKSSIGILGLTNKYLKEVKMLFNTNQFISRELFNNAFNIMVSVYPNLYDDYLQGVSLDKMVSNMNDKKQILINLYNEVCDDLCLPNEIVTGTLRNGNQSRKGKMMKELMDLLSEGEYKILDSDTINEYMKKKAQEEFEEAERRAAEEQYRLTHNNDSKNSDSSGLGFMGTAAAVALGNKISNRNGGKNKSYLTDYRGTSSCQIGKINTGAFTKGSRHINCIGCPIRTKCASCDK